MPGFFEEKLQFNVEIVNMIQEKALGGYQTSVYFRFICPAKDRVEFNIQVPSDQIWVITEERRGDMNPGMLIEDCFKDNFPILDYATLYDTNLVMSYNIPFVVGRNIYYVIHNENDWDEFNELTVYYLCYQRHEIDKLIDKYHMRRPW